MDNKNKEKNRIEWKQRVKEFRASGLSFKKWCDKYGFKLHQLQYWSNKFKEEDLEPIDNTNWISVNFDENIPASNLTITIGKCSIEVKPGFDADHLLN